jgi:hypothetical protein
MPNSQMYECVTHEKRELHEDACCYDTECDVALGLMSVSGNFGVNNNTSVLIIQNC